MCPGADEELHLGSSAAPSHHAKVAPIPLARAAGFVGCCSPPAGSIAALPLEHTHSLGPRFLTLRTVRCRGSLRPPLSLGSSAPVARTLVWVGVVPQRGARASDQVASEDGRRQARRRGRLTSFVPRRFGLGESRGPRNPGGWVRLRADGCGRERESEIEASNKATLGPAASMAGEGSMGDEIRPPDPGRQTQDSLGPETYFGEHGTQQQT
ncbi:unnamed protein product [Diplocarpon coronariae]